MVNQQFENKIIVIALAMTEQMLMCFLSQRCFVRVKGSALSLRSAFERVAFHRTALERDDKHFSLKLSSFDVMNKEEAFSFTSNFELVTEP